MNVAELKQILSELPAHCDQFQVEIVSRVERLAVGHWSREDRPVLGFFVDEHSKDFLLAPREQSEQMKLYAQ